MHIWMGECHVHAAISADQLATRVAENPDAELLIHPECGCATSALYLVGEGVVPEDHTHILSTGGMLTKAKQLGAGTVLVATETGMLHQLRKANPVADFEPVNPKADCKYMKMITPEKLLRSLRENVFEVTVDAEVAVRARRAVERMVELGGTPVPV
jgi:quinolinate synthase